MSEVTPPQAAPAESVEAPTTGTVERDAPPEGPAATDAPGRPPSAPPPWATPTPPPPSPPSGHLLVPKWLVLALAGLVLVGAGFGIGWAVAPGGESHREPAAEREFPRGLPFGGRFLPNAPRRGSGAFLGVATEAATNGPGVTIVRVASGSPAEGAGLKVGDVITAVDGQPVSGPVQLARRIGSHRVGEQVTIAYTRGSNAASVQVKLASRAPQSAPPL